MPLEDEIHARLRELGFREEFEDMADNPFEYDNAEDLLDGLKVDDG